MNKKMRGIQGKQLHKNREIPENLFKNQETGAK